MYKKSGTIFIQLAYICITFCFISKAWLKNYSKIKTTENKNH